MTESVSGCQDKPIFRSLRPIKLRILHVHADAVTLRLCRCRGRQALTPNAHGAARAGFACKGGSRIVQHQIAIAVGH